MSAHGHAVAAVDREEEFCQCFVRPPLAARPGDGADGADQLHERAELVVHLPSSGRGAEVEERSEGPATVPDVSWTFCVSSMTGATEGWVYFLERSDEPPTGNLFGYPAICIKWISCNSHLQELT